jgi:predicted metal-dependent hydrolase
MTDLASSLHYALNSTKQFLGLSKYNMTLVKSNVDGQTYNVRDMPDKQEAADLMARTRLKMKKLKIYVEEKFPDKPQVKQLAKNFDADAHRLGESTPDDEFTSFSVNKGESVHFCLRQRENSDESLVNENIIMFVAIHEMGHIITATVGHGPDFWNNFAWLLEQAETLGVYSPQNFSAHPVSYCGMKITDEPKYDASKDASDFSIGKISK